MKDPLALKFFLPILNIMAASLKRLKIKYSKGPASGFYLQQIVRVAPNLTDSSFGLQPNLFSKITTLNLEFADDSHSRFLS